MKRKGETLTEFLTAATVFGIIMAGVFEFMANQTSTLADVKEKDDFMYYAQRYLATGEKEIDGVICAEEGNTLKVTLKNEKTFTLKIKPQ